MLNTAAMMSALFAAARDTLLELLADPRHLGAQPGILLALHTWGRSLNLHPHIHALVSDGGLRDGCWIQPRRSHFLPATVVMRLFRGKLLDQLRKLHQRGELHLPDEMSRERFMSLANRLGRRVKWNVRVCVRYEHGRGVSIYLARYVKGGPFHNTQIARANHNEVIFRYSAHAQADQPRGSAALILSPERFLARVLAHAPEPNRHSVRYYGLYAHACAGQLNCARAVHQQLPVEPPQPITWQCYLARFPRALATAHCPHCHAPLVRGALIAASRAPP